MKASNARTRTHRLTWLLLLFFLPATASAQDRLYRWEVGPLFGLQGENSKYFDYGGRATVNFNRWIAAEFQLTRASDPVYPAGCCGGQRLQGFGHAKVTRRFKTPYNLSVFGIAGPGFLEFDSEYDPQNNIVGPFRQWRPALNFGGGVEVVPFHRVGFRMDVSDVLSRERFEFRSQPMTRWHSWADYKLGVTFRF